MTENPGQILDFRITEVQVARPMEESKPLTLVYFEATNVSGRSINLEFHLPIVITPSGRVRAKTWIADTFVAGDLDPGEKALVAFGIDSSRLLSIQYGDRVLIRWSEWEGPAVIDYELTVSPENACDLPPIEVLEKRMKSMEFLREGFEAMENEEYDLSVGFFTKSFELDPKNPVAIGHRGLSRSYLNRHEEAVQDFTEALALNESESGWLLFRGISNFHLNRMEEARKDLERYLEEGDPDEEEREEAEGYLLKCR